MLNYLKGFVSNKDNCPQEYEFIYIYFSSSYKHVKIGRSINKKTLKGRYSTYKTQDNAAMMIAYETKMCNTIEEYLRERILPTFRLNGNQSKKSDECYNISLIAAKYAICYTIAKIEYELSMDNLVSLNREILYYLFAYSKDDPETLTYKEDNKLTIVPYRSILLPILEKDNLTNITESFTELTLANKDKRKSLPVTGSEKSLPKASTATLSNKKIKPHDYIQNFIDNSICTSSGDQLFIEDIYDAYSSYIDNIKDTIEDNIYNCGRAAFTPRLKSILGIEKLTYVNSKSCITGYKLKS